MLTCPMDFKLLHAANVKLATFSLFICSIVLKRVPQTNITLPAKDNQTTRYDNAVVKSRCPYILMKRFFHMDSEDAQKKRNTPPSDAFASRDVTN